MASLAPPARLDPERVYRQPAITESPGSRVADRLRLFPARAFLAFGWLRAGIEKLIEPDWWSGHALETFLDDHSETMLPFMAPLVETLVRPALVVTAAIVVVLECLLGVCLLTGRRMIPALVGASTLNIIFVLLGVVTPSAFYLVLQLTLLLAYTAQGGPISRFARLAAAATSAVVVVALAPFVTTLHPGEVIEDPAVMLITLAALAGSTQVLHLADEHLRTVSAPWRLSSEP